jgi:hypothetical protein
MTRKDIDTVPRIDNSLSLEGRYVIKQKRQGHIIHFQQGKNLVTSAGENLVAELLDPQAAGVSPDHIAFGTGTAAALKADTQLQTEIGGTRTEYTSPSVRTTNAMQLNFLFTGGGTIVIFEMGVFNDSVAGTMISRFLVQQLSIAVSDEIDISWTLTIAGVD